MLLLSAGVRGWESIEFKELLQSAIEYLGDESRIVQHKLEETDDYLCDVEELINGRGVTHFFYDPRTGDQTTLGGVVESVRLSWLLVRHSVVPIVLLTDISYRIWRIKGAMVSAAGGIALCFVAPRLISPLFPHKQLFGPCLMPFSRQTLERLSKQGSKPPLVQNQNAAYFIGSLYEPRTTFMNSIKRKLEERGLNLIVLGRQPGEPRRPDQVYWKTLVDAPVILTTSEQTTAPGFDWSWIPNLVYRYLEAIACGGLLIAPSVPCIERYFEPGKHFVSFTTEDDAVEQIAYYLANDKERRIIAELGKQKARALIESRVFWMNIDSLLGDRSIF